jgi:hypothetical protein
MLGKCNPHLIMVLRLVQRLQEASVALVCLGSSFGNATLERLLIALDA